jgi:hypothetical protein
MRAADELARGKQAYVNDAFGTAHQAHASTAGVTAFIQDRNEPERILAMIFMARFVKVTQFPYTSSGFCFGEETIRWPR